MAQEGDGHDAIGPLGPLGGSLGGSRPIGGAGRAGQAGQAGQVGQEPFGWDGPEKSNTWAPWQAVPPPTTTLDPDLYLEVTPREYFSLTALGYEHHHLGVPRR